MTAYRQVEVTHDFVEILALTQPHEHEIRTIDEINGVAVESETSELRWRRSVSRSIVRSTHADLFVTPRLSVVVPVGLPIPNMSTVTSDSRSSFTSLPFEPFVIHFSHHIIVIFL